LRYRAISLALEDRRVAAPSGALLRRSNDLATLLGYQSALVGLDRKVDAEKTQKQIDLVRGN